METVTTPVTTTVTTPVTTHLTDVPTQEFLSVNKDTVDVFPPNSTNQWPILKDMWSFFSGNAGNIQILSVTSNNDVIPDLKLAEKVGGKLTVCVPSDNAVSFWEDVKVVLKERSKSALLSKNEAYPAIAKCWVLSNRLSVNKGIPCVYSGTVDLPVAPEPVVVPEPIVDESASQTQTPEPVVDESASQTQTPTTYTTNLVKIDDIVTNYYFDIVKVDFPGLERFVLNNLMEYGMRPSIVFVRWENSPDKEQTIRAAAATLVNHGYSFIGRVDNKYLYHYNDKPFYNLSSYSVPSQKNPMIESAMSFAKLAIHKNLGRVLGLTN